MRISRILILLPQFLYFFPEKHEITCSNRRFQIKILGTRMLCLLQIFYAQFKMSIADGKTSDCEIKLCCMLITNNNNINKIDIRVAEPFLLRSYFLIHMSANIIKKVLSVSQSKKVQKLKADQSLHSHFLIQFYIIARWRHIFQQVED